MTRKVVGALLASVLSHGAVLALSWTWAQQSVRERKRELRTLFEVAAEVPEAVEAQDRLWWEGVRRTHTSFAVPADRGRCTHALPVTPPLERGASRLDAVAEHLRARKVYEEVTIVPAGELDHPTTNRHCLAHRRLGTELRRRLRTAAQEIEGRRDVARVAKQLTRDLAPDRWPFEWTFVADELRWGTIDLGARRHEPGVARGRLYGWSHEHHAIVCAAPVAVTSAVRVEFGPMRVNGTERMDRVSATDALRRSLVIEIVEAARSGLRAIEPAPNFLPGHSAWMRSNSERGAMLRER